MQPRRVSMFQVSKKNIGDKAESFALKYLKKQKLQFVEKNYYCKHGEIDLIMREGESLIFIEVRYRKQTHYGTAASTVNNRKLHKITKSIEDYLSKNNLGYISCQIDVIGLEGNIQNPKITWIRNVMQA